MASDDTFEFTKVRNRRRDERAQQPGTRSPERRLPGGGEEINLVGVAPRGRKHFYAEATGIGRKHNYPCEEEKKKDKVNDL